MTGPAPGRPTPSRGPGRIIGPIVIAEGLAIILFGAAMLLDGAQRGVGAMRGVLAVLAGMLFCWAGAKVTGYLHGGRRTAIALLVLGLGFLTHGFLLAATCGVNCPPTMPHWVYTGPAIFAGSLSLCALLLWVYPTLRR